MKNEYKPSKEVLEKYADVLVRFALNSGKGIRKGEVVSVIGNDACKPLYAQILKTIWQAGGHVIGRYMPSDEEEYSIDRMFYETATDEQVTHFPKKYYKGLVEETDHSIFIIAETDKKVLEGIDPSKMTKRQIALKPYKDWRNKKETAGKFTWTIAMYGTEAMAKEANLSLKEYWGEIEKACFLDTKNPIKEWRKVFTLMERYLEKINTLEIEKVHVEGVDVDLWITIGEDRKWVGGSGRNIPSFEIFTSPDWRGTNGWMRFNQPLYEYGSLIEGVELEFKDGVIVKSRARKNEKVLMSLLSAPNANKLGEFSLTDSRFSRISKFMAETLFDENVGGEFGNTHIAVGSSFHECYKGDSAKVSKKEWQKMGYNDSPVHTDIVSTTDRTVTAYLKGGKKKVIFKKGKFTL